MTAGDQMATGPTRARASSRVSSAMPSVPPTARGRATYERIVTAAATLVYERGVAGTSMDDVCEATSTSKSQLYHYFADKSALVCAVIDWQWRAVLAGQQPHLGEFATLAELRGWRDHLVEVNAGLISFGGCPIGGVANEVATADDDAREASTTAFAAWQRALADGIRRIAVGGELPSDVDADALAMGLLAALQGGLMLSKTQQSVAPLEAALDHALAGVDALATTGSARH